MTERAGAPVPGNFHALYDRDGARAAGIALPEPAARHGSGTERLAAEVPGLSAHFDGVTGRPTQIWSQDRRPLGPAAPSARAAVTGFVRDRADLWGLRPGDVASVEAGAVSRRGLRTLRLVQRVRGAEVWGSDTTVALTGDNAVLAVAGQLFPGAAAADTEAVAPAEESIAVAASDLAGEPFEASDFVLDSEAAPYRYFRCVRAVLDRPVRAKEVLFPLGAERFTAGLYVEIVFRRGPAFGYVVDRAATPSVLYRNNLVATADFTYLVHNTRDHLLRPLDSPAPGTPHPDAAPNTFQAATVNERAITVESLNGDPWLPANATVTRGNNCVAYADLAAPDGQGNGDVPGRTTGTRTFGNVYDHARDAADPVNVQNSVVGMFFHVNWVHDRWYAAGFDEAAGNAQLSNFGRGGREGDPLLAEGNDFSGTNNANMLTPSDGGSPRMQMFRFTGPDPDRTSNLEALITFHELGHYVTNRLIGNANGLTNVQGRAMGEGWGDIFALVMTSQAGDDFDGGCFAMGGWVLRDLQANFRQNYYFGIRRYPYSTRLNRNPLTFRHISANQDLPDTAPITPFGAAANAPNNEVHNAGEVWCSALWEVFAELVDRHGHTHAERRMLHYLIGALELTPNRPTYVQARDAFITAVGSVDRTDLRRAWRGFAKRGLGTGAVAPDSGSSNLNGVTESFAVPAGLPRDDQVPALVALTSFH